jgi:hypothetical protein
MEATMTKTAFRPKGPPADEKRLGIRRKPGQVIMPTMGKIIHLTLDGSDLGQILDGL